MSGEQINPIVGGVMGSVIVPDTKPPPVPSIESIQARNDLVDLLALFDTVIEKVMKCLLDRLITVHNEAEKKLAIVIETLLTHTANLFNSSTRFTGEVLNRLDQQINVRTTKSTSIIENIQSLIKTKERVDNVSITKEESKDNTTNTGAKTRQTNTLEPSSASISSSIRNGKTGTLVKTTDQNSNNDRRQSGQEITCPVHLTCNCQCPTSNAVATILQSENVKEKIQVVESLITQLVSDSTIDKQVKSEVAQSLLPNLVFNAIVNSTNPNPVINNAINMIVNANRELGLPATNIVNQFSRSITQSGVKEQLPKPVQKVIESTDKALDDSGQVTMLDRTGATLLVESLVTITPIVNPDSPKRLPRE